MSDTESNKIQGDLDRLEQKIDSAISRLDEECSRLSNGDRSRYVGDLRCRGGMFWGVVLVLGGLVWLADSLGWIQWSMPGTFVNYSCGHCDSIQVPQMKPVRLTIVGATGIVGKTTLDVLTEWNIPIAVLRLISSASSSGQEIGFGTKTYKVESLHCVPDGIDVAIFATSSSLSKEWVPKFRDSGITVIDHSSYFRMNEDVPLVIPEINAREIEKHKGIVANPNCSASVMMLPMHALQKRFGLKRVIADTYQSVSGAGRSALDELEAQSLDEVAPNQVFPRRISQNVIPEVGTFDGHGATGEEQKIGDEIRKILSEPSLQVLTTAVRVPVRIGHAAAITIQLKVKPSFSELEAALELDGMIYEPEQYRTPLEIAGKQEVFVSRLRQDKAYPDWVQLWCVGDNLRKGAASNAVQILERLCA